MNQEYLGRCPSCLVQALKYTGESWTTEGNVVRLIMVCNSCSAKSIWKLEELVDAPSSINAKLEDS